MWFGMDVCATVPNPTSLYGKKAETRVYIPGPNYRIHLRMKHAQQNTRPGEGLCSNACTGRGKRRRRPCSSVRDALVSCASGKRKHGPARARTPQRSTFKEHVPRPGRSRLAAAAASVKVVIYGFRDHAKTAPPIIPPPRVRVGTM